MDRLDKLKNLEARLLAAMSEEDGKSLAQLARQYRETIREIEEIEGAEQTADRNAQDGAAGSQGHGGGGLHENQRRGHAHNQLGDGFQNLRDGGGQHIALALEEAPEGTHDADQQHTGAQTADGKPGIGLILENGQLAAEHRHQEGTGNAQS